MPSSTGQLSQRTMGVTQLATPRTAEQRAASARGKSSPRAAILILGVIVAIGLVAFFVVIPRLTRSTSDLTTIAAGQEVSVDIPDGAGGTQIAQLLKSAGVISSTDDFFKEVQKQNADQSLKSGTYTFITGADVSGVVKQLVEGPNGASKLTIAEGLTVNKTAAAVESSLGISADDFLAQAKASNYVGDYPFLADAKNDSLEGFLYPKTYSFGTGVTSDQVIRAMLDQYKSEVDSLDFATAESNIQSRYGLTMSEYDIVTLASIVEKEAVTDDDRPLVSSVFYNRLSNSQVYLHYLQSDATLTYALGYAPSSDELHSNTSPYNTYLNAGLPPTPICNPSLASIKAAMEPSDTSYLYFLIIENGSYSNHTFSETYDEHLAAIAQAQQDQAS